MSDTFSVTTRKSWFSRIGSSIVGVPIGLLMLIAACVVLFWNEGRAVQTARSLAEGKDLVVSVDPATVDPGNEGKLIHISGDVNASAALRDPEFGVAAQGLRLVRTVEMYQWKEESRTEHHRSIGGSEETVTTYTYRLTWGEGRIDSSHFHRQEGHDNPQPRYAGTSFTARDAELGAYRPGQRPLQLLPASQGVRVDAALAGTLRARVSGPVQVIDGRYYLGADPGSPRLGDLRISYKSTPNGPASFIGRQSGRDLGEYQTKSGDKLLMARSGLMTSDEMFKLAQDENRLWTWIWRAVGTLVMLVGTALILSPLGVLADVVPMIGSIVGAGTFAAAIILTTVLAPAVVAIAWLWYRPIVSLVVIGIGLILAFGFRMLAARRTARMQAKPA